MTPGTTNDNIKTVEAIYDAFGRGDVGFILDQLTDDIDWSSGSESSIAPWYGVRHGKAETAEFFKQLGEAVSVTEFTPLAFASNDTDVMTVIRFAMTSTQTGRSGVMNLHHWWRFREAKIYHYRGTEDTAQTAQLLSTESEAQRGRKDGQEWTKTLATQAELEFIHTLNDQLGNWPPVQRTTTEGSTIPTFIGQRTHTTLTSVTLDATNDYWMAFICAVAGINLPN
ncbi:nuclear transport factor 2 family protein [Kribbella sp. NPDC051952]|uniref:nuclear transport factor 2 family protein n=1 Tax=Kribbella sp. NPDC051952 TaxID=3154851 RepID=UPI003423F9A8